MQWEGGGLWRLEGGVKSGEEWMFDGVLDL